MCGITGFLDFQKRTSLSTLREMTDAMHHRGPDDAGYEIFEHTDFTIGFGQRRLSILDLSPLGHQPMHFGDLVVNFNGEIYNFKEIRKELEEKGYSFNSWSDTEVILKGYHCWGLDVLQKLIGMFAIALDDKSKEKIFLIRDRAGIKPLY
ncbi:MAG: asparagine synthetase B, partial [Chitinophagaceae bacterium]